MDMVFVELSFLRPEALSNSEVADYLRRMLDSTQLIDVEKLAVTSTPLRSGDVVEPPVVYGKVYLAKGS